MRRIFDKFIIRAVGEGDHAPSLVKRQHEFVAVADDHRLELGAGDVQRLEWQLHVCECQLAERCRIGRDRKSVERREFVAEHGRLELRFAIGELLSELVRFVQVQLQLGLTCLKIFV